jgi:hypothetical protein
MEQPKIPKRVGNTKTKFYNGSTKSRHVHDDEW